MILRIKSKIVPKMLFFIYKLLYISNKNNTFVSWKCKLFAVLAYKWIF